MTEHRATPEQWKASERRAANGNITDIRLLELRARVAELEEEQTELANSYHFVVKAITERLEKLEARHFPGATKMVPPPVATDEELAPLLWVLWHHQGGKSDVGQPIRKYLGMGQFERMSDKQIDVAKHWAQSNGQARSREVAEPGNVTRDRDEAGNYLIIHDTPTPPPELVSDWTKERALLGDDTPIHVYIATKAMEWGANQVRNQEVTEPPPVTGALVERVSWLIADFASMAMAGEDCTPFAVRVILEVARWLRSETNYCEEAADLLERQARR